MYALRIYLALTAVCVYAITVSAAASVNISKFPADIQSTSGYDYRHYYMNNPTTCGSIIQLNTEDDAVMLSAWGPTQSQPVYSCSVTFSSYGSYGMKYKFDSTSSYLDCDVYIITYVGKGKGGGEHYKWFDTIPSDYFYTHTGYVTVQLSRSELECTDFDFKITLENYDNDLSGGDIAAIVISIFVAILLVVVSVVVCVKRRKRILLLQATMIVQNTYGSVRTSADSLSPSST